MRIEERKGREVLSDEEFSMCVSVCAIGLSVAQGSSSL
jgi:hypothetical protein